uniref:Cytoskeleton-associated protein 2 C-terminal domain-containing protein n=1 Tax=Esox lucius TaxID=8010 RepID=A0A3P8Z9W0_ESOLU
MRSSILIVENKENAKPESGPIKSLISRAAPTKSVAAQSLPFHFKYKRENLGKEDSVKVKTEQKGGKAAPAGDMKRRNTLSQAFLTKQAVRQRKLVAEATKHPATAPTKPVPGTYKGKVVQSRISSFRKPGDLEGGVESKATNTLVQKAESRKPGNFTTVRSKSVTDLPGRGRFRSTQSCQPSRSKSVCDGPPPISKFAVPSSYRPGGSRCAVPSAVSSKVNEQPQSTKPKMTGTMDKKVHKPPVSSSLSQYRANTETAEERRAKLAEWLASKGKVLKRPPISAVAPRSKQVLKPENKIHPEVGQQEVRVVEPEPSVQPKNNLVVSEQKETCTAPPLIMNTTLDLLDNSDTDFLPVDPEIRMNDVVVNLCDALEAMEIPSACANGMKYESEEEKMESKPNKKFDEGKESSENTSNCFDDESEVGASEPKARKGYFKEVQSDCQMEKTPEAEGASMVKYCVKTTPYLQSVKRTIDGETCGSASRRKSAIKDLKFLTPVRRSCRIQRKSCRLPGMLADHDTCVSSLAELVNLDDDANAYIYRRNPAILGDLPWQTEMECGLVSVSI